MSVRYTGIRMMNNVIQFKQRSDDLEAVIELLDVAYGKLSSLQDDLVRLEEATSSLQQVYDNELKALAHRLGGIENCPVDYLIYTTLDSEVLKTIEEKLWKEIGSLSTHTSTTNT